MRLARRAAAEAQGDRAGDGTQLLICDQPRGPRRQCSKLHGPDRRPRQPDHGSAARADHAFYLVVHPFGQRHAHAEGAEALERYRELTRIKIERNAKLRREKLANSNEERQRTLQASEEDKADRKRAEELRARG